MAADRSTGVRIELLFCYVNFPFIIPLCARACPAKTLCRVPVFLLTIIAYSTMCLGLLNHFHKENSISNFPLAQYRMYSSTEFPEQTKVVRSECWEFNKCICLYKFGLHLFHGRSLARHGAGTAEWKTILRWFFVVQQITFCSRHSPQYRSPGRVKQIVWQNAKRWVRFESSSTHRTSYHIYILLDIKMYFKFIRYVFRWPLKSKVYISNSSFTCGAFWGHVRRVERAK